MTVIEGENDRDRNGGCVSPPKGCGDHHAENLANRAASEAVGGGAKGRAIQRCLRMSFSRVARE
jgi:hypothetical protein